MRADVQWDPTTKWLHGGLALLITFQLFSGLLVSTPNTLVYFYAHEIVGLLATVSVLLVWLWAYANEELPLLFPWNGSGMAAVGEDVRGLINRHLPKAGPARGLSSFVHGLGLLAVTGMAVTGLLIFFVIPGGRGASMASTDYGAFTNLSIIHRALANLVWAYWVGHIAFALLHQFSGNNVLGEIFGFPRKRAED